MVSGVGENTIFGYGSLISPISAPSRFSGCSVDAIYESELEYGDDGLVSDEEVSAWEAVRDKMHTVPVKIRGFQRHYSLESRRGGAMIQAAYTGDDDDVMNGVIITGLTDEQKEAIDATEPNYEPVTVDGDDIEPYISDELLMEMDVELPDEIALYAPDPESDNFDKQTGRRPNRTYHDRILDGIDRIAAMYGDEVGDAFREDFRNTVYVPSLPGGQQVTVAENGRAEEEYARLIDDEEHEQNVFL
jgi:hypothetical protein